jgi:hypothetical protein
VHKACFNCRSEQQARDRAPGFFALTEIEPKGHSCTEDATWNIHTHTPLRGADCGSCARRCSGLLLLLAIASLLIACGGGGSTSPNTAVLAWDAVADPNLAGYRIYYGTSPLTYTQLLDVGNVTICTVTGLSSATRYYFAATAYSMLNDESVISNEVFRDIP